MLPIISENPASDRIAGFMVDWDYVSIIIMHSFAIKLYNVGTDLGSDVGTDLGTGL